MPRHKGFQYCSFYATISEYFIFKIYIIVYKFRYIYFVEDIILYIYLINIVEDLILIYILNVRNINLRIFSTQCIIITNHKYISIYY